MKTKFTKSIILGCLICTFFSSSAFSQVVFTSLAGNASAYLTQGATNQVVYGFSVKVPASGTFSPGPVHIAVSSSLNGFVSGNLVRTTAATASLAISAPQASYSAAINGTIDINGFPNLTGGTSGTTYYFYLVLSITTTANTPPTNIVFSLPSSGSISQNGYSGGITVSSTNSQTYNFGIQPPSITYATPQIYTVGTTISALSPVNTGGAVGAYGTPSTFASVNNPSDVAIDASGNVYVLNNYSNTLNKYTSSGSTLTNSYPTTGYNSPQALIFDGLGNLYVSNYNANTVSKITSAGVVTTIAVTEPLGLAVDASNNVYVASQSTGNIYEIAAGATSTTTFKTGFNQPWGVAINSSGDLFVSQTSDNTIYKVASGTTTHVSFATGFNSPRILTLDGAGNLYVADCYNNAIKKITTAGAVTTVISSGLNAVTSVAVDSYGNIYATNYNSNNVVKSVASGYTISPALPAGLYINAYTGTISGTPTAVSAATSYTVTATNSSGSMTAPLSITVLPSTPTIAVAGSPGCGSGSVTLTASGSSPSGGAYSWYSSSTGSVIATGTTFSPIVSGTYYASYTVSSVTSAMASASATINPIVSSPYSNAAFSYPFSGNTNDVSGSGNNGIAIGSPALTTDRYGAANSAYSFNGSSQYISSTTSINNPTVFTISLWFNTTTAGGRLIGFGTSQTGSSVGYDRNLYMTSTGQLYFGIYNGAVSTINTANSYNDGIWHHVVVTVGSDGSTLYVDGVLQASSASMTTPQNYAGYWRIGYDNLLYWTNAPSNYYFTGKLDDVAVYNTELTSAQITASNNLNQIGAYASVCSGSAVTFYAPTITGATYTWKDPTNTITAMGQNATFSSAATGNYTLTVTGGPGGCSSTATVPYTATSASATFTATSSVFAGSNATITYTGTESSASTYTWNFNGGTVVSGSGQGPYQVNWSTTGTKTITLTVVSATTGCSGSSTQTVTVNSSAAVYGNYAFRKTITLNTTSAGITSSLANFPALLSIQDNDLIISGTCTDKLYSPSGPNYDFAFVDPSSPSTELYYQVENYNQTTGTLLVWVQIPSISPTTNNTLSFYYGSKSPTVTHNAAFFANTWTSDYQVVYHFNESGYTGTTADGTANNRTATLVGFQASDYTAAGKIGSCYLFGGTSGSSTANDMEAPTAPATSAFTISAWAKMTVGGLDEKIITDQGASGNSSGGYKLGIYINNIPETEDYGNLNRPAPFPNSTAPTPNAPTLSVGTWYYLTGVYNGSSISTYVNGVQYAVLPSTGSPFLTSTLYIGIGEGKQYPFSGYIDEPRVSNIAKSSDWMLMEYVDQNNPVAFTSIGSTRYVNAANAAATAGFLTYTWAGGSTDITNASNWNNTTAGTTGQLPAFDGSATLVIPAGLSNYPVLTASESLYGLNIASGAYINLNGYSLSVGCNIYNSSGGQLLYGSNTSSGITWNGSQAAQYYYGSSTASTGQVGNMVVNNSAAGTVNISGGGLDVYGSLTMTKGNLAVGASPAALTLKSTATQSANVAAIPAGSAITGNVTVERYVTGGSTKSGARYVYRNYRLLSSPVNEGADGSGYYPYSLNYIAASTIVTDCTSSYGTTGGNPSLYLFKESYSPNNVTFTSGNFVGVTNISNTAATGTISTTDAVNATGKLYAGDGFMMYFRGDNINNLTGSPSKTSYPYVAPESVVFSTTGNLNQGTYSVVSWTGTAGLMYTTSNAGNAAVRGFNLVGNPYASSIDWSTFSNTSSSAYIYGANVNPSIYILNPVTSNYDTYSAATNLATGSAGKIIPSGQGFFVQANAASPTLTFTENAKSSAQVSGSNLLMGTPDSQTAFNSYLRLKLVTDSINYDDMVIGFNSTSTTSYNGLEDTEFLPGMNSMEAISGTTKDNVKTAVKWLPFPKNNTSQVMKLNVSARQSGLYTLQRTDFKEIPAIYEVWLMDNLKKDSLDLRNNSTYAFNLDVNDTTTYGSNRFVVVVRQNPALGLHLLSFTAVKAPNGASLVWTTENEQNYTNFTVERSSDGGLTYAVLGGMVSSGIGTYSFLDKNPPAAADEYRVKLVDLNGTITYTNIVTLIYGTANNSAASNIVVYPNPASSTLNLIVNQSGSTLTSNLPANKNNGTSVGIAFSPASGESYNIKIFNVTGSIVKSATSSQPVWQNDISSLLPGTYIIQVTDNNKNILLGTKPFTKL